jgi:hypothetical protein
MDIIYQHLCGEAGMGIIVREWRIFELITGIEDTNPYYCS